MDTLKDDLDAINRNVDQIAQLHNATLTAFRDQHVSDTSKDLARLKRETQKLNMDMKNRLKGRCTQQDAESRSKRLTHVIILLYLSTSNEQIYSK